MILQLINAELRRLYALLAVCLGVFVGAAAGVPVTEVFNWSEPGKLTPAYPAPTSSNRYGEYIGKVSFTAGEVTLYIDDSNVREQSQRARFLYGYNTGCVEMRSYPATVIRISVPDDRQIEAVSFAGAKVGAAYMVPVDGNSEDLPADACTLSQEGAEAVYSYAVPAHEVFFYITQTINCTSTAVKVSDHAGLNDVIADADAAILYYTLQGVLLPGRPSAPGVYVQRSAAGNTKVFIR